MSKKRWSRALAAVAASLVCGLAACGGGETNPLAPSQGVNEPPRVTDIVSDPATVPFGASSHVSVTAEDPNGDALVYEYQALHGSVAGQGAAVMYTNDGNEGEVSDTIRVTIRDARGAITISAIGLGLGKNPPPYGENPFPKPRPAPTPRPTPTPAPNPNPNPTPKPPSNKPPTVSISGETSCHPQSPSSPCSVVLTADASDPNGDSLSYSWSGCTSGTGHTATCSVGALGPFTAHVTVSDGHGGQASASYEVTGLNDAPVLDLQNKPSGAVACDTDVTLTFKVTDDQPTGSCRVVQVAGRCVYKSESCGTNYKLTVTTTEGSAVNDCVIKGASWTDPWGVADSSNPRFSVQACP